MAAAAMILVQSIQKLPLLFSLDKTGKVRRFGVEVLEQADSNYNIQSHSGLMKSIYTYNNKLITKGKNIGKKNETTKKEQALKEAKSLWDEKRGEGYKSKQDLLDRAITVDGIDFGGINQDALTVPQLFDALCITYNSDKNWRPLPMLAEKYRDHFKKIVFPVIEQPKLNGLRCLASYDADLQEVVLCSRDGSTYTIPLIQNQLHDFLLYNQNVIFDGEIFKEGKTLQEISGAARREKDQPTWLEYHLYDLVNFRLSQVDRLTTLQNYWTTMKEEDRVTDIKLVPFSFIADKDELKAKHDYTVSLGYEGIMIRKPSALYQASFRTIDLLKVKEYEEEEFVITGVKVDPGKSVGDSFVFELQNNDGSDKKFYARPTGTIEEKEHWFIHYEDYIGEKATVRFQERSLDGLPTQGHVRHKNSPFLVHIRPQGE